MILRCLAVAGFLPVLLIGLVDRAGRVYAADAPQTLRYAIMKLPIEYREPLVMQVLGGFSTEEIARELELTNTAVLTRLFRARSKLRGLCGPNPEPGAAPREQPA